MIAGFKRWHFSNADSVEAPSGADELVLASVGGDSGGKAPAPHLPAPSFLPKWPLSAPALSILGRHCLRLCIIFSQPASFYGNREIER